MPKVKTLQGDQIPLPITCLNPDEMTAIKPVTVRFLLLQQGKNVPWVGVAIAQNSSYQRVRYLEMGRVREGDIPRHRLLPLEQTAISVRVDPVVLHDQIAQLERERDRLRLSGEVASHGCWIETGLVKGRQFRQAWWRSQKPMFPSKRSPVELVKTCYIGQEGGADHKAAITSKERRNRLKWIEQLIQNMMESV